MTEHETSKCIPVYGNIVIFQGFMFRKNGNCTRNLLLKQYVLLYGAKNEHQGRPGDKSITGQKKYAQLLLTP